MSNERVPTMMAIALAAVLSLAAAPVAAATSILTPAGTKIGLTFLDPVDTAKAASGDSVRFQVAADVIVSGYTVIRRGTTLTGTVNAVGHPFPQNAGYANISSLAVRAVDRKMVGLKDVRISAPLFGGNVQVAAGTLMSTSTKVDTVIAVPQGQR